MEFLLRNAFLRSLLVLGMGVALIVYSDIAPKFIVQALGVLFIIPGLVTALYAFSKKDSGAPMLPSVVGGGSVFFGVILLLLPGVFINILMYLLAVLLILAGGIQLMRLVQLGRDGLKISLAYFVFPILTLLIGMYVLMQPNEVAAIPFKIIGIAAAVYALIDLFIAVRTYFFQRSLQKLRKKAEAAKQTEEGTAGTAAVVEVIEVEAETSEKED